MVYKVKNLGNTFILRVIENETPVISYKGNVLILNDTSAHILLMLKDNLDIHQITNELSTKYKIKNKEDIKSDIEKFIISFKNIGLLGVIDN